MPEAQAINEIASTAIFLFAGMGLVAFVVMAGIAWHVGDWFPARRYAHAARS